MDEGISIYEVECFREKPDPDRAAQFLEAGNFSWNAGMFIWSVPTVIKELSQHAPQLVEFIGKVKAAGDLPAMLAQEFPKLEKISIDYALMEKASRVLNIEATFDWDDVGGWISVANGAGTRNKTRVAPRSTLTRSTTTAPPRPGALRRQARRSAGRR